MYVRCPNCQTIFAITQDELNARTGMVRCGVCRAVYNASWNLLDQLPAVVAPAVAATRAAPAEEGPPVIEPETPQATINDLDPIAAVYQAETAMPLEEESADLDDEELPLSTAPQQVSDQPFDEPIAEATSIREQAEGPIDEKSRVPDAPRGMRQAAVDVPSAESTSIPDHAGPTQEQSAQPAPSTEPSPHAITEKTGVVDEPPPGDESEAVTLQEERQGQVEDQIQQAELILEEAEQLGDEWTRWEEDVAGDGGPQPFGPASTFHVEPDEEIVLETPAEYWQRLDPGEHALRAADSEQIEASVDQMRELLAPVTKAVPDGKADQPSAEEPPETGQAEPHRVLQRTQLPPALDPLHPGIPGEELGATRLAFDERYGAAEAARAAAPASDNNVRAWQLTFWWLGLAILIGLGSWQIRTYYLSDLAQVPALRPYLAGFCKLAACEVPKRRNSRLIDLVGTSVETHPEVPGALRVTASLINRASFVQRPPLLEVTLSDKLGRVVGRRTYSDYRSALKWNAELRPNVVTHVTLDLATPSEEAVGYEIQLIPD